MDYMPYYQMMSPGMCSSPMANYPAETLGDMYPDIYRVIYPKVINVCVSVDVAGNTAMQPYPSREMVDRMVDDIYNNTVMEIGDQEDDSGWSGMDNRQFGGFGGVGGFGPGFGGFGPGFGFGRRRFLRDIISILLIRELLRRRGFRY